MVQIKPWLVIIVFALMSACSMQPMIDASLPEANDKPSQTPVLRPVEPAVPTPVEPNERAVVVTEDAQLPAAAQSLLKDAAILRDNGNSSNAIIKLERAAKIAPRSALVYFELAQTYWQQTQAAKAKVFANKALSLASSKALVADIKALLARLP